MVVTHVVVVTFVIVVTFIGVAPVGVTFVTVAL